MLTKRTIWIYNFSTTLFLFIVFLIFALQRIFLESNDKDFIVIGFSTLIFIYMFAIVYFFYTTIFKWDKNKSQSFYITNFPVAGLCMFLLINAGRSVFNEVGQFSKLDFGAILELIIATITCGLNVATFCFGLLTKRD